MNMKNKLWILSLLFLTVLPMGLTSCDQDDMDEITLTGRWRSVDDTEDIIYLDFYDNHEGLCTEYNYYQGGYPTRDNFTWFIDHHIIYIDFGNGNRWTWDYDLYNGHTATINGRLFSRERDYYSKKFDGAK